MPRQSEPYGIRCRLPSTYSDTADRLPGLSKPNLVTAAPSTPSSWDRSAAHRSASARPVQTILGRPNLVRPNNVHPENVHRTSPHASTLSRL